MTDFQSTEDGYAEMHRVCAVLESIAAKYAKGSLEAQAIEDATEAFVMVSQHQGLARRYQRLKAMQRGEFDNDMLQKMHDKLRECGIDPTEFDEEE